MLAAVSHSSGQPYGSHLWSFTRIRFILQAWLPQAHQPSSAEQITQFERLTCVSRQIIVRNHQKRWTVAAH
jgi:hypothetical protein